MFCSSMFDIMLPGLGDTNNMGIVPPLVAVNTKAEHLNIAKVNFG